MKNIKKMALLIILLIVGVLVSGCGTLVYHEPTSRYDYYDHHFYYYNAPPRPPHFIYHMPPPPKPKPHHSVRPPKGRR